MTKKQRIVIVSSVSTIFAAMDKMGEGEVKEAEETLIKAIRALQQLAREAE